MSTPTPVIAAHLGDQDGYEKCLTTGTVFVELSAAYDTVNLKVLLTKLYGMTEDAEFTKLIGSMMSNQLSRGT